MKWRSRFRHVSMLMLVILMSACASAEATPTPVPAITQKEAPATESASATEAPVITESPISPSAGVRVMGSGQCANAYYPVREGATWTYESTGSPAGTYRFTDTITSVREDAFTLTSQFGDLTRTQEWGCQPEGLVALELGGPAAATIDTNGVKMTLDVTNISGVTYPNTIAQGDEWQHSLEFTGMLSIAGQEGDASGTAQSNFTAVGMESVTVPAGTFEAMKIEVNSTVSIGVSFQGMKLPVTFTGRYTYWFVEGVGWVRAGGTGDVGGQSFTEVIELQSYSIP